jgi:hypothetical protein
MLMKSPATEFLETETKRLLKKEATLSHWETKKEPQKEKTESK